MQEQVVTGFLGEHEGVELAPSVTHKVFQPLPAEVDLPGMARWCQNYLAHNPLPEGGWQPRFSLWGLHLPILDPWPYCSSHEPLPDLGLVDPVVEGDTDSRMDYAYVYMRETAGSHAPADRAEQGVRHRVRGYIRDDGLSWIRGPIDDPGDPHRPRPVIWTTAKALWTESELFRLSQDDTHLKLARAIFGGLRRAALWDNGRAYYLGPSTVYRFVVEPLVRYWEVSADEEALDFARACAEGMLANVQPGLGAGAVQPDGSFCAHVHCQMHAIGGVAHLGAVTREPRYVEWARRVYEFIRRQGTDYGWFPEAFDKPAHTRHTEICLVADMICTAVWLGEAGYPDYFDHAERYARNMLRHAQFFMTPELETLYRQVHSAAPQREVERQLEILREIQGGFVASPTPNDLVDEALEHHGTAGDPALLLDLMGCCPPEGMRALHTVWRHTVTARAVGVFVNMTLPCRHREAEVATGLPASGLLRITAGQDAHYFLRPPAWAPRAEVRLYRDDTEIATDWQGAYLRTPRVRAGEQVSLEYPLISFTQEQALQAGANTGVYRITWLGNTVLDISPRGKYLPLPAPCSLPPHPGV